MNDEQYFRVACENGHLDVAKRLFSLSESAQSGIGGNAVASSEQSSLSGSAQSGNKVSLRKNINISSYDEYAFRGACENGHLKVAQWLLSIKPTIDISSTDEYAFRYACANNHLNIAQWLLTIKPTIDISAYNDDAFSGACKNGYLEVAQWLLKIKPTIDISVNNENAFLLACVNEHLHIVQWLLTIKPTINISVDNDIAFKVACIKGCIKIAQWLQNLLPNKYELVIKNNKIISYRVKCYIPFTNNTITLFSKTKGSQSEQSSTNKEEFQCHICYNSQVEVQTNCGHNFCTTCITNYYNKCNGTCNCPYCRQTITCLNKLLIE